MKTWNSPAGRLQLKRHPFSGEKSHQAWDAADEWILRRLKNPAGPEKRPVAVCGEAFGVLATAWGSCTLTVISDSHLSLLAVGENRRLNPEQATGNLTIRTADTATGGVKPGEPAASLVLRLPKSLELLEIYLKISLEYCDEQTAIWVGGMEKRWNRGTAELTENYLETEEVFPFERHARWIRYSKRSIPRIKPELQAEIWQTEKYSLKIKPAPAVFSGGSLDAGTLAFIEVFPEAEAEKAALIADIGCGSGILGLAAAAVNPEAEIIFNDESHLAIKAAAANAELNGITPRARFVAGNGLSEASAGVFDKSIDMVLCNPPFHYKNIQTREPAEFMFAEALRVLRPGGCIQIVGNSHLGYHKLIKKYFPDSMAVLRGERFTVIRGRAPAS